MFPVRASVPFMAALAISLLGATSCDMTRTAADSPAGVNSSTRDCAPSSALTSVDALQRDFSESPTIAGLAGGDMAAGLRLDNGAYLMAFGDSLLDTPASAQATVRNSLLAFETDRVCLVLGPHGAAFIPDRRDGVGYWPTSLLRIDADTIALFAQRVVDRGGGRFANLGPSVAEVRLEPDGIPYVVRVIDIGPDDSSRQRIGWGAASWVAGDAYVYGTANPERDLVFGWSLHVARTTPDRILDIDTWQYWSGEAWSAEESDAAALIPAVGGVDQTLSVFESTGSWYAVSKRDGFLGRDVVAWVAPAPTGPFIASSTAAERPSDLDSGIVRYAAIAHPDLLPLEGTVVVSISGNSTDPADVNADPTIYRPEFLRIPLP